MKCPSVWLFFTLTRKSDCEQSSGCGHHDKEKNQEPAEILLLRYFAYFALRCRQNCHPIKRKDNDSDCIPTRNRCTPEPKMFAHGKERRRTGGQSHEEAMPCVLPRYKIDDAHVSDWLSLSRTRDIPTCPIHNAKCAAHRGAQSFFRARTFL